MPCKKSPVKDEKNLFVTAPATESDNDPFNFVEVDLFGSTVVEPSGASRLVVGHLLRELQPPAVAEVLGDPRGPEGVAADARSDARSLGTPTHHPENVGLRHGRF